MTLKEFSEMHLQPDDAYMSDDEPVWQKAFPTNLRFQNGEKISEGHYAGIFHTRWMDAKYERVLAEEWVRIHEGQIIDREFRPVYSY